MAPRGEETSYEVEYILRARLAKGRKSKRKEWKYFVKWVGYGRDHNSWEPEKNFDKFSGNMVDQFWRNVDLGDRDGTDLRQFNKIGEEFFPTSCPPANGKRKTDNREELQGPPPKIRKTDRRTGTRSGSVAAEDTE